MHLNLFSSLLLLCIWSFQLCAQNIPQDNSVDIYNKIEKLNVLGSVLYFAAHPDDENTRLISYMANERKMRTAYLSMTRGDGGQNLIGTEIWEQLGLIRTNELLQARSVDGGQQFFTRANDFGYSKHPDETLAFWNKDEVMHDITKVIREFKPDVIINRFDHRTPGRTHGHHTSSAMLSVESYDITGDPTAYKDRLGHLNPWQPSRIFFNTSWWFYGSRDNFEKADKSNLYAVDGGVYFADRGISNTEIAANSRTMHKSQGFGSTGTRGASMEYVELVKGDRPLSNDDPLSGLNLTWTRVEGGAKIRDAVNALLEKFDYANPAKNIPSLVLIHGMIQDINDDHWKAIKSAEVEDVILQCAGLYASATTNTPHTTRGQEFEVTIELVNRSETDITVREIIIDGINHDLESELVLGSNERERIEVPFTTPEDESFSNPYWLNEAGSIGMYTVSEQDLIGQPASPSAFDVSFRLNVAGLNIDISRPVLFRTNSPVDGEVNQPLYVVPEASVQFSDPIYIFSSSESQNVNVTVKAFDDDVAGKLSIQAGEGWKVTPEVLDIHLKRNGQQQAYDFTITPPAAASSSDFEVVFRDDNGNQFDKTLVKIEYDHIPHQIILKDATAKFERLNIEVASKKIAYLQGAGDKVAESLRQIGCQVDEINVSDLNSSALQAYDALVIGIRAYNTLPELMLKKEDLVAYMEQGGNVIVQYNTSRRVKGDDIAPYPMELSRDRVTDELSEMQFLAPGHEALNYPNKITQADFDNWVQERGLYFPNDWDERYTPIISSADKGEDQKSGGILIAEVGKGNYVYTGISWFRQLPAGVAGAYRLFANLLSLGKNDKSTSSTGQSGSND